MSILLICEKVDESLGTWPDSRRCFCPREELPVTQESGLDQSANSNDLSQCITPFDKLGRQAIE